MENSQIEETHNLYANDPDAREEADDLLLTQTLNNYERALRVIADLERGLQFVARIKPYEMFPHLEHPYASALGACEGEALVALCAIPREWKRIDVQTQERKVA
jgi:hypothetical protein